MRRLVFIESQKFDWKLVASLIIISLFPSFAFVAYKLSSLAIGLLVSSFVIVFFNIKSFIGFRFKPINATILSILIFALFISTSYYYVAWNETKPIISMVIVPVLLSAIIFAQSVEQINYEKLSISFLTFIIFLIIIGWLKLFWMPSCCNYEMHVKPVFPFSEESHYALIVGVFSVAYSVTGKKFWITFIGINLLLLALIFPNLTLLIYAILVFFVVAFRLKTYIFISFIIMAPILIILILNLLISNYDYFSSRLTFEDTNNMTTLVYLQGWQMAYLNLIETKGIGLGFQMLGSDSTQLGYFTDKIIEIGGKEKNIMDGGFIASKLISEFGIIGVFITIGYAIFLIKFVFYANQTLTTIKYYSDRKQCDLLKKKLLLLGLMFAFLVEYYFRGYGYFSPSIFFLILALAHIRHIDNQIRMGSICGFSAV